jgi:hypothetical protein
VSTVAGSGKQGYVDGKAELAEFDHPTSIAVDNDGCIYVADNNSIRKICQG